MSKRLFFAVPLILASLAMAADPAGTYSGKILIDKSKMPKAPNPEQQKQMDAMFAKIGLMKINLVMKSNKTFTISMEGGPLPKKNDAQGTWSQKGDTVTMKTTKQDGKDVSGANGQVQNLTLSKDGRTLTLDAAGMGAPGKIVFTKK
jgi:hypothetical protein